MSPAQVREELASIGLAGVLRRIEPAVRRADHAQRLAEPTLIVPVDQAEALFASDGQDEAQQFLAYLDALREHLSPTVSPATGGRRLRVLFVLTIRSDSLPKLQGQRALQAMSPVRFSLPAMPMSESLIIPPLLAGIRAEERLLRTQSGVEYDAYCARTSRLTPGSIEASGNRRSGMGRLLTLARDTSKNKLVNLIGDFDPL